MNGKFSVMRNCKGWEAPSRAFVFATNYQYHSHPPIFSLLDGWSCSLLSLLVPLLTYVTSLSHTQTYTLSLITVNKCTTSVPLTELFAVVSCIGTMCLLWIRRVQWSCMREGCGWEVWLCAWVYLIIRYKTKL